MIVHKILQKFYSFLPLHDTMYSVKEEYKFGRWGIVYDNVVLAIIDGQYGDIKRRVEAEYGSDSNISVQYLSFM